MIDDCITIFVWVCHTSTWSNHAKSLQSCPTLCDPIDGSPPGSPVPGILQARTLEWVAISFSSAWRWKEKVKSLSLVSDSWRPHGLQPTRLLRPWDFPGKSAGAGCHCLLWHSVDSYYKILAIFLVLYSMPLYIIYFIYNSLCLLMILLEVTKNSIWKSQLGNRWQTHVKTSV